jgi:exosortase
MTAHQDSAPRFSASILFTITVLGMALAWSYWTTLGGLVNRWWSDPQYSHGFLVPVFALHLLWQRRDRLNLNALNANWLGLGMLVLAMGLRLAGARYHFEYFDQISLLPCVAGLFMLAGSWHGLLWSMPAVAYLAFMIPLPHSVSLAMSGPMQTLATLSSTFVLQVLGRPALAEGNVILLNDIELGIVEACSGLRMLVVFFALSTAVALLIRKPLWEKLLLGFSAIPIALASNIMRIVITGLCYEVFNDRVALTFHDAAGLLMPLIGIVFLLIEMWILKTLLIERANNDALAAQITLQRVEANPIAIYRGNPTPRREPEPEPVTEEAPVPVTVE